jgi:protein TonB
MSAVMYSGPNRAFNYAVLASIVLHAALLFGFSLRERARPIEPAVPIVAHLVELPAAAPAPAVAAPQPETLKPPPAARPRPKPAAQKPVAKETPAPRVERAAEPAAEEAQLSEAEPAAPVPAPAAPAAIAKVDPAPAAAAAPSAGAADAAPSGADARSVAEYRLQLIVEARKHQQRYPRVVLDNNWEGLVALRMAFSASGRVAALSVTKTSGYDIVDQQAMEIFKSAAAAVPVPPLLRGKEFAFDLAVTYYFTE